MRFDLIPLRKVLEDVLRLKLAVRHIPANPIQV